MKVTPSVIICLLFIGLIVGMICGYTLSTGHWQTKLINAKMAEWTVDPKTGHTYFILKP